MPLGGPMTLWLFGSELNIYSFVGLILLIGLVVKNAIMQDAGTASTTAAPDELPSRRRCGTRQEGVRIAFLIAAREGRT